MLQPVVHQQGQVLQPLPPHLAPALPHQRRIRRIGLEGEHGRAPGEIIDQQAAAHVMDVIGIAVVGGAERDHRLQLLRPARRHLQPVEAAPGDADHAAGPRAPGLRLEPFQHLETIVLLQLQIFVQQHAVGFARAADVDPHRGIAMAGEEGMGLGIARRRAVALAIGQIFQDRRHGMGLGIHRQPDARRELRCRRASGMKTFSISRTAWGRRVVSGKSGMSRVLCAAGRGSACG